MDEHLESMRRGRPRLDEVAELAGVSSATVSRVLNGTAAVRPATRQLVEAAVAQLGYVPNPAARSLVTGRTNTIALAVSEPASRLFSDPFFAAVVRGISASIADTDLELVLLLAHGERESAKLERYVRQGHVDGVVLLSVHGDDPLPQRLVDAGVPTVLSGRPSAGQQIAYVDADNRGGARAATAYLLASGKRTVATVTGPLDMTVALDRYDGYRDALAESGLPVRDDLIAHGDFTIEGGERAMGDLLTRQTRPDAIFVASDPMAVGVLLALAAHGLSAPEDVAVVGFDDAPVAATTSPPLTTVRQPLDAMSRELIDLLRRRIADTAEPGEHVICETELIRRASA